MPLSTKAKGTSSAVSRLPLEIWILIVGYVAVIPRDTAEFIDPFKRKFIVGGSDPENDLDEKPFSQINTEDLKSLRLVNKTLNQWASPELFLSLVIRPFGTDVKAWTTSLLDWAQRGHAKHVETVWITSLTKKSRRPEPAQGSSIHAPSTFEFWSKLQKSCSTFCPRLTNLKNILTELKLARKWQGSSNRPLAALHDTMIATFVTQTPCHGFLTLRVASNLFDKVARSSHPKDFTTRFSTVRKLSIGEGTSQPTCSKDALQRLTHVRTLCVNGLTSVSTAVATAFDNLANLHVDCDCTLYPRLKLLVRSNCATLRKVSVWYTLLLGEEDELQRIFRRRDFLRLQSLDLCIQEDPDDNRRFIDTAEFHWETAHGRDRLNTWISSERWQRRWVTRRVER